MAQDTENALVEVVREGISRVLESSGFGPRTAESAARAVPVLEFLLTHDFDLMVEWARNIAENLPDPSEVE